MSVNTSQNLPGRLHEVTASYRSTWLRPHGDGLAPRLDHLRAYLDLALDEPAAVQKVQDAAAELREVPHLSAVLPSITDTAVAHMGADFGNIQVIDPRDGSLVLVTQSGFRDGFIDHFSVVRDASSVCGQAARQSTQTVVADVRADRALEPHQQVFRAAGVRAVQSTPLIDPAGRIIGMISTHASQPGRPSARDLKLMELYGRLAGEIIAQHLDGSPATGDGLAIRLPDATTLPRLDNASVELLMRQVLSDTINRIFSAGLNLAGTLQLVTHDDHAARRVQDGLDELDEAIRQIQRAALEISTRHSGRTGAEGTDRRPSEARLVPGGRPGV
ncbi:GAF domain-containing protein [Streptomyces sp. NPDC051172]|uniref:GAF domain-containing protein n=1 Tax=Streptomyces sp. NPDC051172 TaxID=3155796 RepID=UPI00342137DA